MRAFLSKSQTSQEKSSSRGFSKLLSRLKHVIAWESKRDQRSRKHLVVKRITDPTGQIPDYLYTERLGKNSLAFIGHDAQKTKNPWLILQQWHGPLSRSTLGAFTGSLDKPGASVLEHLRSELIEEAGLYYSLSELKEKALYLGLHAVGGNTSEQVHLFLVDITAKEFEHRQPESVFEENTKMFFTSKSFILAKGDWKSKLITMLSKS